MNFLKFKMNKRGEEESSSTGAIIAAVIAAVVIVLVIIGLWLWFSGSGLPFASYLPGFNQTKPPVVDMEILRYRILQDKVQYYDGIKWNDFSTQGSVEMNGKKIEYNPTFYTFRTHFWPAGPVGVIKSDATYIPITVHYSNPRILDSTGENALKEKGIDIHSYWNVYIVDDCLVDYECLHILTINNKFEFVPDEKHKQYPLTPTVESVMKNEAIRVRDSFLDRSIAISYSKDGIELKVSTCIDRNRYNIDKDLQVNLANPVAANAEC